MRTLRIATAAAGIVAMGSALSWARDDETAKVVNFLLSVQPFQKGVEYDIPADAAAVAACKVEQSKSTYTLRDGNGQILRRFADTNGTRNKEGRTQLDQWSYYKDGFEVYRENDFNEDKRLDECRWLNSGGTRVAIVSEGKIKSWKRISAEEASKVLVQALNNRDAALIETVMATPDELSAVGAPKSIVDLAAASSEGRAKQVSDLAAKLSGWTAETAWQRLDAQLPHLIPADSGLKDDLTLYESAIVWAGKPSAMGADAAKTAFLQVPEIIKVGDTWKFVTLPGVVQPGQSVTASSENTIRTALFRGEAGGAGGSGGDPKMAEALNALAAFDSARGGVLGGGNEKEIVQYHFDRIKLLKAVVAVAPEAEKVSYDKQIAAGLAEMYATGQYPAAAKLLDQMVALPGPIAPYAAFRKLNAEFQLASNQPGSNPVKEQKTWLGKLKDFLDAYPKSDEVPDALYQLATTHEFNGDEDDARPFYARLAKDFPEDDLGKKAAGVLRRLDLVGKPLELKATTTRNATVDASQYRGRSLLVDFWASWSPPARRDLPELKKVYEKFHAQGFEILGVNLDNDRADLDSFLQANPAPWAQVYEKEGLQGRLAHDFGIIALPTMILVDRDGKVVNRGIRSASDLEVELEKLTARGGNVALGNK